MTDLITFKMNGVFLYCILLTTLSPCLTEQTSFDGNTDCTEAMPWELPDESQITQEDVQTYRTTVTVQNDRSSADTFMRGRSGTGTGIIQKGKAYQLNSDFKNLRISQGWVDKTLFLKHWMEKERKHIYFTAPAEFGKSSLLSMCKMFLEAEYHVLKGKLRLKDRNETEAHELFLGTNILTQEPEFFYKHFKQYTVIFVNFSHLQNVRDEPTFRNHFCQVVKDMVHPFKFLLDWSDLPVDLEYFLVQYTRDNSVPACVKNWDLGGKPLQTGTILLQSVTKTFKRPVILLVDDYDSVSNAHWIRSVHDSAAILSNLASFIQGLTNTGEDRVAGENITIEVARSHFTGVLSLDGPLLPGANNIIHRSFFANEDLAIYYGLLESEAKSLIGHGPRLQLYEMIKYWYVGYSILNSELRVLNIPSVLRFISEGRTGTYIELLASKEGVMRPLLPVFSDYRIGDKISECLFRENTTVQKIAGISETYVMSLKNKLGDAFGPVADYDLSVAEVNTFLTYLLELGFFSAVKEVDGVLIVRPANRLYRYVLYKYLEESKYAEKRFKISRESKRNFMEVVTHFQPCEESVKKLGDAVFEMFRKRPPMEEHALLCALYLLSDQAVHLSQTKTFLEVDAAVEVSVAEAEIAKREAQKQPITGKIDFLWVVGDTVVIIEAAKSAELGLKTMIDGRYFDLLTTHGVYSKLKIKYKVFVGISVARNSTVSLCYLVYSTDFRQRETYTREVAKK